ncbi:MAG: transcriptional regulator, partial [Acidobacteria bacterium]|nr:transcriptional regulator [Acidobacteriota bacterium]
LIHERLRLGILSALAVQESLSFTELRDLLETTDGNLSVQARKLEEAGYVTCDKRFEDRKPRSTYRLSHAGRAALRAYIEKLSGLLPDLDQARNHAGSFRAQPHPLPSKG